MQKLMIIVTVLYSIVIFSCNNKSDKKTEVKDSISATTVANSAQCALSTIEVDINPCKMPGGGNLVIDPTVAQDYMREFVNGYQKNDPALQSEYWVDACIIGGLSDFFRDNKGYDGAWVTFASEEDNQSPVRINFVPTMYNSTTQKHDAKWASAGMVKLPASCNAGSMLTTDNQGAKNFRSVHRKEFTTGIVNGLSRKIWVDSCVINSLNKIVIAYKGSTTPLDGVYVYSGTYNGI